MAVCAILVSLLWAGAAFAFIDPRFTPVQLAQQAETIAVVQAAQADVADVWTLSVVETLKGNAAGRTTLGLAAKKPEEFDEIRRVMNANGRNPALLFAAAKDGKQSGFLSVGGVWLAAESADGKTWNVTGLANRLSGTWAGGTDALVRCTRYCLAEPKADVPASVGAAWMDPPVVVAKIDGKVAGLAAIDLPGQKDRFLFVASPRGDRLFRAKTGAETFEDVTAQVKLTSRSTRFAWLGGEFVSWDGKMLRLFRFRPDGTFASAAAIEPFALDDCLGLAPLRLAGDASVSFLVSTRATPFLLSLKRNAWTTTPLPGLATEDRTIAFVSACVVADFDGDGLADVLQPRAALGLLWRGRPGGFAPPMATNIAVPDAAASVAVADFNQDGALDVFVAGAKSARLYENDGKGAFADVTASAGSLSYKATGGASACLALDLNHDGRTDLALLSANAEFTYHFNRGFRCFGEEGELRLPALGPDEKESVGQVAGAAADFNGDGSLDLAVAFADGRVACFYNDAFSKPVLRVGLKAGAPGPVTVSLWQGVRSPMAWSTLSVGPAPARVDFTLHSLDRRECTLRWRRGDGAERSLTVTIPDPLPEGGIPVTVGD